MPQFAPKALVGKVFVPGVCLEKASNEDGQALKHAITHSQRVAVLGLQQNIIEGQLPMDWAEAGRWPNLTSLQLWNNSLTGSIPASWSNATALPALNSL